MKGGGDSGLNHPILIGNFARAFQSVPIDHRADQRRFDPLDGLQQIVQVAGIRHQRQRRPADQGVTLNACARVYVKQGEREQRDVAAC